MFRSLILVVKITWTIGWWECKESTVVLSERERVELHGIALHATHQDDPLRT